MCGCALVQRSTASRDLTNLELKATLSIQICRCSNENCPNHKAQLKPSAYINQIIPESGYGLDVYGIIGQLRFEKRYTIPEIHAYLGTHYKHIEIGERHTENIVNDLELSIAQSSKNAEELKSYFESRGQEKLQLSADGVEPEKGHSILYIVREVISGKILFAHYSTYSDEKSLTKEIFNPLKQTLTLAGLEVGGWVADKELALGKAIIEGFKNVPFQHCQSHFLSAMKKPLTSADTEMGKSVKKTLVNSDQ